MIIDSHCHLEFDPLHGDLDAVFKRAFSNNVKYFLTISTKDSSFDKILQILKKYKSLVQINSPFKKIIFIMSKKTIE